MIAGDMGKYSRKQTKRFSSSLGLMPSLMNKIAQGMFSEMSRAALTLTCSSQDRYKVHPLRLLLSLEMPIHILLSPTQITMSTASRSSAATSPMLN